MQTQFVARPVHVCTAQAKARNLHVKKLSGTKFRQLLRSGQEVPEWFAFKSVVQVLRDHAQHTAHVPKPQASSSTQARAIQGA